MPIADYSPAELQPRKLTADEIADPLQVIDELFNYGHLPQIREMLWDWFKVTVAGNYSYIPKKERINLVSFYEKLEKTIEALHLIHSSHSQSSKKS